MKRPDLYIIAEDVLHLLAEDAGRNIIRINNTLIGKKGEKGKFYRRQPVLLDNPNTGLKTLRFVMGSRADHPVVGKASIMLDYDTKVEIGFDATHLVNVIPATEWDMYLYYWSHPDPGYRVSTRLGIIGAVLGILGVILAILPWLGGAP